MTLSDDLKLDIQPMQTVNALCSVTAVVHALSQCNPWCVQAAGLIRKRVNPGSIFCSSWAGITGSKRREFVVRTCCPVSQKRSMAWHHEMLGVIGFLAIAGDTASPEVPDCLTVCAQTDESGGQEVFKSSTASSASSASESRCSFPTKHGGCSSPILTIQHILRGCNIPFSAVL